MVSAGQCTEPDSRNRHIQIDGKLEIEIAVSFQRVGHDAARLFPRGKLFVLRVVICHQPVGRDVKSLAEKRAEFRCAQGGGDKDVSSGRVIGHGLLR